MTDLARIQSEKTATSAMHPKPERNFNLSGHFGKSEIQNSAMAFKTSSASDRQFRVLHPLHTVRSDVVIHKVTGRGVVGVSLPS